MKTEISVYYSDILIIFSCQAEKINTQYPPSIGKL